MTPIRLYLFVTGAWLSFVLILGAVLLGVFLLVGGVPLATALPLSALIAAGVVTVRFVVWSKK